MSLLVTGGAGFIGSNFILDWLADSNELVINLDKLTYAGNLKNLISLNNDPRHKFFKGCIGDNSLITKLMDKYKPRAIINFAAETHVDRSIIDPHIFLKTNIVDTFNILETIKSYWQKLPIIEKKSFRFIHISTDEVYGSLKNESLAFTEDSSYKPNSPYSASKAASDHLVRSYFHTYGLPVLTTHASNNYGPHQFTEKLIPKVIHQCLSGNPIPIYGNGQQIRDWLYVKDHCKAIMLILKDGKPGEVYNSGSQTEKTNIEVVNILCDLLDYLHPRTDLQSYRKQISYVEDRPGHDQRYAINANKIQQELGWKPIETFESGIRKTVEWYLAKYEETSISLSL